MKNIKELEHYFTKEEIDHILPLLKNWTKVDSEIVNWFNTHKIASCSNETPYLLCEKGNKHLFIRYMRHIEFGGYT